MATRLRVVSSAFHLFFDGASKGNPGPSAGGWCLKNEHGNTVAHGWKYLGARHTNNEAEYTGLIEGLTYVNNYFTTASSSRIVYVHGDSDLVVRHMLGQWRCKSARLQPLWLKATELVANSDVELVFSHVPRAENKEADRCANMGVKEKREGSVVKETPQTND
jgi:ribonuclease HI